MPERQRIPSGSPFEPLIGFSRAVRVGDRVLVDAAEWEAVGRAHGAVFGEISPAATMVVVAALLDDRWRVEIEAEAVIDA